MRKFVADFLNGLSSAELRQHNDFYIVEYPKSGITWLSCLLANVALIESGRCEIATFSSIHHYVPDIHMCRKISNMIYDRPPVRFIKSHAKFTSSYISLIYLTRHPLSVLKSYYRYNIETEGKKYSSFIDFCKSRRHGVPAWRNHVNSWLRRRIVPQRLSLVKYEDLLKDPARELLSLSTNFGWEFSESSIQSAISRCSIYEMKKSEETYRSRDPRYSLNFVAGSDESPVDSDAVSYICNECQSELRLLGY